MRRVIAALLILGMASPAVAQIRESAAKEAALVAQPGELAQARPNAPSQREDNPYFIPAIVLLGAGGLVTLYGLMHETGVECDSRSSGSFSCGTTKSKATIFTGVGIVGAGVWLFYRGQQKSRNPQILV